MSPHVFKTADTTTIKQRHFPSILCVQPSRDDFLLFSLWRAPAAFGRTLSLFTFRALLRDINTAYVFMFSITCLPWALPSTISSFAQIDTSYQIPEYHSPISIWFLDPSPFPETSFHDHTSGRFKPPAWTSNGARLQSPPQRQRLPCPQISNHSALELHRPQFAVP